MQYDYAGGVYAMGRKTVAAHQTTVIDVRALRDGQVPDTFGKTIPSDVSRGQVRWTMKGREDKVLIGRAEQVDFATGISSSYACRFCCPNKFNDGFITPEEVNLNIDDSTQFTAWQRDIDCYGHIWSPFDVSYLTTWSSSDSEIADGGFQGRMTAYGAGTAMISGSWTADSYFADIGSERCDFDPVQALATAFLNIFGEVIFIDVSDGVFSSSFSPFSSGIGTYEATLNNVDCSGTRIRLRVKFRVPSDSEFCCTSSPPSSVTLLGGNNNLFQFATEPISGTNGFVFFGEDNPPFVDIYLRRRADGGGTNDTIAINVRGRRQNGMSYAGRGEVKLQCR